MYLKLFATKMQFKIIAGLINSFFSSFRMVFSIYSPWCVSSVSMFILTMIYERTDVSTCWKRRAAGVVRMPILPFPKK